MVEVDLSRFEPPRDPSDTKPRMAVELPESVTATAEPEPDEAISAVPEPDQPAATEPEPEEAEARPSAPTPKPLIGEETEPLGVPLPSELPIYRAPLMDVPEAVEETQPQTEPEAEVEPEPEALAPRDEPMTEPATPVVSAFEPAADAAPAPIVEPPEPRPEAITPPEPPASPEPSVTEAAASIWEVFGVPRPSETQEAAIIKSDASEPSRESVAEVVLEPVVALPSTLKASLPRGSSRIGLRIVLRRKLVRLRRP